MASNLRRSRRALGQRFLTTERNLEELRRRGVPSRIGSRVIVSSNLGPGAVKLPALDSDVTQYIQATADGKNAIYRQPTAPSGGNYAIGDLWFDTDDGNKIYRNTVAGVLPTWEGFTLGDNALASISANKITAGTIDASVVTVSNINAGNITTGTLQSIAISGVTITIGAGSTIFKADSNGIYSGSGTFATAPFSVNLSGSLKATSGTIGGLTISATKLYYGVGNHANADTQVYMDNVGKFSLGNKLSWDGTNLSIQGTLKFTDGSTPGTFDNGDALTAGTIGGLTITSSKIYFGTGTYANANTQVYMDNIGQFSLGNKFTWNGTSLAIAGDVTISGTAGSTIAAGAADGASALQPGDAADDVNANTTTISGGKIRTGSIESTGYSYTSGTYSTAGTAFDLSNGIIRSKNFAIDSSGNAFFRGSITSTTGVIGGWTVGTDALYVGTTTPTGSAYMNATGGAWFSTGVLSPSFAGYGQPSTTGGATATTTTNIVGAGTRGFLRNISYGATRPTAPILGDVHFT